MRLLGRLISLLSLVIAGCHLALPLSPATDGPGSDGPVADLPVIADLPPARDGQPDLAHPDLQVPDLSIPHKTDYSMPKDLPISPDMAPSDLAPDVAQPDVAPPLDTQPLTNACKGTEVFVYPSGYQKTMVICKDPSQLSQCNAKPLCNIGLGWALCTASEFQANGGKDHAAPVQAWIAGCSTMESFKYLAPADGLCDCSGGGTATVLLGKPLAIHSHGACRRIGEKSPATEAYWLPLYAHIANINAAVCCK